MPEGYALPDGFSSHAQSFRIVTRLAFREPYQGVRPEEATVSGGTSDQEGPSPALNLTRATLAGMSKYPWTKGNIPESLTGHDKVGSL